jgi:hypothetical protein
VFQSAEKKQLIRKYLLGRVKEIDKEVRKLRYDPTKREHKKA